MPRKKKHARDLTTDELMRKLFPKEAVREAQKTAREQQKRSIKKKDK
jgi:hypothetical protein